MMWRCVDLFCGGGGAALGLKRAGFTVDGYDIERYGKMYPGNFYLQDALTVDLRPYDFIWTSPPCNDWSALSTIGGANSSGWLLEATRAKLIASGKPYIIENVPGAPLINPLRLCGSEFGLIHKGLLLKRHRYFESNLPLLRKGVCTCRRYAYNIINVTGHGGGAVDIHIERDLMGIHWLPRFLMSKAVPPVYAEWLGRQVINHLEKSCKSI